jgi:hypothetical protein
MSLLGRRRALAGLVALLAGALVVAGCGKTVIDDVKTEEAIEQNLERSVGSRVASVDCPSGIEVEVDVTFDCAVSLEGGKQETATLKILNEDADVEVTGLEPDEARRG